MLHLPYEGKVATPGNTVVSNLRYKWKKPNGKEDTWAQNPQKVAYWKGG